MLKQIILGLFAVVNAGSIITKGDLEGIACSEDEAVRYQKIVCGETIQNCELEWCKEYIHDWRKKFGACNQIPCQTGAPGPRDGQAI